MTSTLVKAALASGAIAISCLTGAVAQSTAPVAGYKVPRTPAGHPEFGGVWLSHSILELEALPEAPTLVVPEAEATVPEPVAGA